jgi:hypothetical protein
MNGYGATWNNQSLRVVNGRLVVVLPVRRAE